MASRAVLPRLAALSIASVASGASVTSLTSLARAELPRADVAIMIGPRLVHPFTNRRSYESPLAGYGYRDLRVFMDLSVASSLRAFRYLDVGARATWLYGSAGTVSADGAVLHVHAVEAMAFVRPFYRGEKGRAGVGIELGAGLQGGFVTLRGAVVSRLGYVIAPTFVAVLASTEVQPALRVGPVFSRLRDALGGTDLPTGGLSFSVGGNLGW